MNSQFDNCYRMLFPNEGGFANLKGDAGGETLYGVSKRYHPKVYEALQLAKTDRERDVILRAFYKTVFYDGIAGDEWPEDLAFQLFDAAVHCGVSTATGLLQKSIWYVGEKIVIDGRFGPKTGIALKSLIDSGKYRNVLGAFLTFKGTHYLDKQYGPGFMRRLVRPSEKEIQDAYQLD